MLDDALFDDALFDNIDDFSPSAFAHPPEVEKRIEDAGVAACIELLLARLNPREREVLERTLGLGGGEVESITKVAESWDVSRTRVAQVWQGAIEKARSSARRSASPVFEYLAEAGYPERTPTALVSNRT